jgi:hypothetical protein
LPRLLDILQQSEGALNNILEAEKEYSDEITALSGLAVFPSSELVIIRKDAKLFKEYEEDALSKLDVTNNGIGGIGGGRLLRVEDPQHQRANVDSLMKPVAADLNKLAVFGSTVFPVELQMCEKKVHVMRTRRQEEQESRAAILRKQARLRAAEEAQTKDPSSFRNQRNRL